MKGNASEGLKGEIANPLGTCIDSLLFILTGRGHMWHMTVASKQVQSGIEHSECAPRGEMNLQVRTQRRAILPQPGFALFLPVQSHPKWRGGMGSCLRDEVLWKDTTLTLDSSN